MKEIFDWLREQIRQNAYTVIQKNNSQELGMTLTGIEQAIDEAEVKQEEDCCEWKKVYDDVDNEYKPLCSDDGFIEITGYFDYTYCPYCGKRIKISEVEQMKELIYKGELVKVLKRTSAFECIRNSADKNVFEIISDMPTATEAEIRAKVIGEVVEALKKICSENPIGVDTKANIPLYGHRDGTWHDLIKDVAEQLKEEQE